ncbi:MAG: polyprenyl diphosphate synthase [Patescibacteria group bacterium]|nr:polyprenyl diphosphate synthase [Patescibacteria group bacterium]
MKIPQHIAILCDGNRRWAKQKNLPEFSGHKYAIDNTIEKLVDHSIKLKIPFLTFWVLSTENWKRGQDWMEKYFKLMHYFFNKKLDIIINKGAKLKTIGDLNKLPKDIQKLIKDTVERSKNNNKITIIIAINYGGQDEIIRAINKLFEQGQSLTGDPAECRVGTAKPEGLSLKDSSPTVASNPKKLTPTQFSQYLDTSNLPNPDLLIRPGGHSRFSNFMLWQTAYTQLYFTNILFPDFKAKQLDQAIQWWQQQTQNLGK